MSQEAPLFYTDPATGVVMVREDAPLDTPIPASSPQQKPRATVHLEVGEHGTTLGVDMDNRTASALMGSLPDGLLEALGGVTQHQQQTRHQRRRANSQSSFQVGEAGRTAADAWSHPAAKQLRKVALIAAGAVLVADGLWSAGMLVTSLGTEAHGIVFNFRDLPIIETPSEMKQNASEVKDVIVWVKDKVS